MDERVGMMGGGDVGGAVEYPNKIDKRGHKHTCRPQNQSQLDGHGNWLI